MQTSSFPRLFQRQNERKSMKPSKTQIGPVSRHANAFTRDMSLALDAAFIIRVPYSYPPATCCRKARGEIAPFPQFVMYLFAEHPGFPVDTARIDVKSARGAWLGTMYFSVSTARSPDRLCQNARDCSRTKFYMRQYLTHVSLSVRCFRRVPPCHRRCRLVTCSHDRLVTLNDGVRSSHRRYQYWFVSRTGGVVAENFSKVIHDTRLF